MEHVKGSQTDKILIYIRDAAAQGKSCTGPCISKDLGLKRSNVYVFLKRLRKWHTIEVMGEGAGRTFTYIGETKLLKGVAVSKALRKRAFHLLNATKPLSMELMSDVLNIGPAECLELAAYLIRAGQAQLLAGCAISTLPK